MSETRTGLEWVRRGGGQQFIANVLDTETVAFIGQMQCKVELYSYDEDDGVRLALHPTITLSAAAALRLSGYIESHRAGFEAAAKDEDGINVTCATCGTVFRPGGAQ